MARTAKPGRRRQADAAEEEGIRQRLRSLLDKHSQAEIARKTGVLPSRVSRYLNDTAIPAVFCLKLIKEFDVNPAWLLAGEGAPFLSDLAERTGRLAGDLLEVVNALNAVSRLRIGSLGGKRHGRMLRELGDAMASHDRLHKKLNTQSAPILKQVMHDLGTALDKVDIDQRHLFDKSQLGTARGLAKTAEQLARFCDDPRLRFDHALLQARLATYEEDLPGVLEATRRAILLAAGRSEFTDEPALATLAEAVDALRSQRRLAEARRVAESALAAAKDDVRNLPPGLRLAALVADIQIGTGEIRSGTEILMRVRRLMAGPDRQEADAYMATALLFSGAIEVREAAALGTYHLVQAARVLSVALIMETPEALKPAMAYWDTRPEITSWERHYAGVLLRAVGGGDKRLEDDVRSLLDTPPQPGVPAPGSFLYHYNQHMRAIYGAQIYRVMGKPVEARQFMRESTRAIAELPDWYSMTIGWSALHMRNVLGLGAESARQRARDWFLRQIDLGYRSFAQLAERPDKLST